jgi:hypothetical protein
MAASVFDMAKANLLTSIGKMGVCEAYYQVANSVDFPTLLEASCGYYTWAYKNGVVDDITLNMFPEQNLNDFGVYRTDASLSDPVLSQYSGCSSYEIEVESAPPSNGAQLMFIESSNFNVNLSGANIATITAMKSSNGTITLDDNSECFLNMYQDSIVTVNLNSYSSLCMSVGNYGKLTINATANSSVNGMVRANSSCQYNGTNNSSGVIKVYAKSFVNKSLDSTAYLKTILFNKPTLTCARGR